MTDVTAAGYVEPRPTAETAAWWSELAEGRLTLPTCGTCHGHFFPPQPFCPHCGSAHRLLVPHPGGGTVYSWVVVHRSFAPEFDGDVPYGVVAVDLDGGGRLVGRFAGDPRLLRAGLSVTAEARRAGKGTLLWFRARDD